MFCVRNVVVSWFCLQVMLCLMSAQANTAAATVCAPLSRFKIDCNTCYCSVDGRRYTCSKRFCSSDVSLNYNDFMSDAPQADERIYFNEDSDDWTKLLNDLATNNEEPERKSWQSEDNEIEDNNIDYGYGDYLKEQTEYLGSRKPGHRY